MDELNKKIEQIILEKGYTPSYFADAIGVQRSSISHILSGRNKPSLDIIQKILKVFPDIDRDWLLFDSEEQVTPTTNYAPPVSMPNNNGNRFPQEQFYDEINEPLPVNQGRQPYEQAIPVRKKYDRPMAASSGLGSGEKQIERILVFYTDGTFTESRPI
jgi:transcriptional regulator with XRE-family HTH domain